MRELRVFYGDRFLIKKGCLELWGIVSLDLILDLKDRLIRLGQNMA